MNKKEKLINHIKKFVNINDDDKKKIIDSFDFIKVNKKDYLLETGKICNHKYFIVKGCFRYFAIDEKGNEKILKFGIEDWWLCDYDSYTNNKKSEINIQALENSELLKINKSKLEELFSNVPLVEKYFRIIYEKIIVASQRKSLFYVNYSSEEIFNNMLKVLPEFAQRVPQYMIASYLGFTPEFVSKIKRQ